MKKLTAFLLALCLMLPVLPAHAEEPPAWAAEAYAALKERHVIIGLVGPSPVKRGEFVDMLIRLLDNTVPQEQLARFSPVWDWSGSTFAPTSVARAMGYGIVEGTVDSDGSRLFNGDAPLTREQAAKMVCSLLDFAAEKIGYPLAPSGSPAVYADAGKISSWALPYTERIAAYELMKGDSYGNFDPQGGLDYSSSVVLTYRIMELLDGAVADLGASVVEEFGGLLLQSALDSSGLDTSLQSWETFYTQPWYPRPRLFYTISNGDGTVSLLAERAWGDPLLVERFGADGNLVSSRTVEKELPIFGAFLDSGDHFYLAFGQKNDEQDDNKEVWRIVQYDREWNRIASASVNGGDSYTTVPFFSTANTAMTLSEKGTLCLHTARQRYLTPDDGLRHQSNITITVDTANMSVLSVSEQFPFNHASHSFDQHARYDGDELITVDRGDMYPRSFVLYTDRQNTKLLAFARRDGQVYQQTNSNGCGLEVSKDGYLFLGCSDPQDGTGGPWNVFLTCTAKEPKEPTPPWPEGSTETSLTVLPGGQQYKASWRDPDGRTSHWGTFLIEEDLSTTTLTWLTHSDTTIGSARLVKLDDNSFVALWQDGADVHYQKLDGKGQLVGQEQVFPHASMSPTDPVVIDGDICWIQGFPLSQGRDDLLLYRIDL